MNEERKAKIIKLRSEGKTLQEIGKIFGVSRQRIEQLELMYGLPKRGRSKAIRVPKISKNCDAPECKNIIFLYPRKLKTQQKFFCSFECNKKVIFKRCMYCKVTENLYKRTNICRKCNTLRLKKWRQNPKSKKLLKETRQKQDKKFPEKVRARANLNHHLKKGNIKKLPCFCGETKVDAHHNDYSKPLEVIWFCRIHHIQLHKNPKIFDYFLHESTMNG